MILPMPATGHAEALYNPKTETVIKWKKNLTVSLLKHCSFNWSLTQQHTLDSRPRPLHLTHAIPTCPHPLPLALGFLFPPGSKCGSTPRHPLSVQSFCTCLS